ncbi:MAG: tRNA-dihydrouridine synthase [Candidatus Bathyarchaeota archaeon]|nr:tRNA-dihydrouridine synthase [Candidatus Bathyarchaeota archaeon]
MGRTRFLDRLVESKLMLPPLAGYTDPPFRTILAKYDPPFIVTEMINATAIIHRGAKTLRMMEKPVGTCLNGVQLVGSEPSVMGEAAAVVESLGFDYVDINMGCTINKVAGSGAGISLMRDEERAYRIASAVVDKINIPLTCKIRLGATKQSLNATSLTRRLVAAGVTAIAVHGRSGEKKFGLPVDYEGIKEVVEASAVPVVANGGIFTGNDAVAMLNRTGAAAVMPGRGIIGNPWLIEEIRCAFSETSYSPPSLDERKNVCIAHLRELCEFYGEESGVLNMRKILPQYFSGYYHAKDLKRDVEKVKVFSDVETLLGRLNEDGSRVAYGEYP